MVKSIVIPKTPKSAYNPKRKISSLLKAHIANLEAVTHRKLGVKPSMKPRNEGQASAYIAELTKQLHPPDIRQAPPPVPAAVQPAATMRQASNARRRVTNAPRSRPKTARRGKAKRSRAAKK